MIKIRCIQFSRSQEMDKRLIEGWDAFTSTPSRKPGKNPGKNPLESVYKGSMPGTRPFQRDLSHTTVKSGHVYGNEHFGAFDGHSRHMCPKVGHTERVNFTD